VTNSVVANNSDYGFYANGTNASLMVFGSVAANNGTGINAVGGATIFIGQSTVTGNENGWETNGSPIGSVLSYGNNQIDGNAGSEAAPPSTLLK
jgi:hypothetical protein